MARSNSLTHLRYWRKSRLLDFLWLVAAWGPEPYASKQHCFAFGSASLGRAGTWVKFVPLYSIWASKRLTRCRDVSPCSCVELACAPLGCVGAVLCLGYTRDLHRQGKKPDMQCSGAPPLGRSLARRSKHISLKM